MSLASAQPMTLSNARWAALKPPAGGWWGNLAQLTGFMLYIILNDERPW